VPFSDYQVKRLHNYALYITTMSSEAAWGRPRVVGVIRCPGDGVVRVITPIAAVQRAQFRLVDITASQRIEVLPLYHPASSPASTLILFNNRLRPVLP
jgi:hypothetical protein